MGDDRNIDSVTQASQASAEAIGAAFTAAEWQSAFDELKTRVVKEPTRDTWFVVNTVGTSIDRVPLPTTRNDMIRRISVNSEPVEHQVIGDMAVASLLRPLRNGEGTIVVVHYR